MTRAMGYSHTNLILCDAHRGGGPAGPTPRLRVPQRSETDLDGAPQALYNDRLYLGVLADRVAAHVVAAMNESPETVEWSERTRLRSLVRQLHGSGVRQEYVVQVERVLVALLKADRDRCATIVSPDDITHTFRREKLLPKKLVQELRKAGSSGTDAEVVCFAACMFPDKRSGGAARLSNAVLPARSAAFLAACRADNPPVQHVQGTLCGLAGALQMRNQPALEAQVCALAADPTPLLADLCAEGSIPESVGDLHTTYANERIEGAALYLSTCPPEALSTLVENWGRERVFVRFLIGERVQQIPPYAAGCLRDTRSVDAGCPRARACIGLCRNPGVLVSLLHRTFPAASKPNLEAMMAVYRAACRVARKRVGPARACDTVQSFWEDQFSKLVSGFPAYSFWQPFLNWSMGQFKSSRREYDLDALPNLGQKGKKVDVGVVTNGQVIDLNPETLRQYMEGYRLVRSTFFWNPPARVSCSTEELVKRTECLRAAADDLFLRRLLAKALGNRPETVDQIAADYPDLGKARIWTTNAQIRLRMRVYHLARFERMTNEEIERTEQWVLDPKTGQRTVENILGERPAAVNTIASLARSVPPPHSLLGAFTARVFLHPGRVDVHPMRPDPWDLNRFVAELWWWGLHEYYHESETACGRGQALAVSQDSCRNAGRDGQHSHTKSRHERKYEEAFLRSIARGASDGSSSHKEAWDWMEDRPIRIAMAYLRKIAPSEEQNSWKMGREIQNAVDRFLARYRRPPFDADSYVDEVLRDYFDAPDWEFCSRSLFQDWVRLVNAHWIVPAWYVVNAERCDYDDAMRRLKPDDHDRTDVGMLVRTLIDQRSRELHHGA
jgi:hypothetical protein